MASNLRVDSIVPATGSSVSIGTATGGVNIPGVLTYEDVTNVDSIGIVTARGGIRIGAGSTVGPVSGIITYFGDGSQLTGITGTTINNNADNRVITGSGTANRLEGEANLTFNGNALEVNNTSSNTAAHFKGSAGAGFIQITDSDDSSTAFIGVDGGSLKVQTSGGSYSDKLRISSEGYITKPNHPSFSAHTTSTSSANTDIVFGAAVTAIGSHYSTSNGRFTAPVAGNYFFSFHGMGPHANSSNARCHFRINGAAHGGGQHYGGVSYAGQTTNYTHVSMSTILPLSVNDYVTVYWEYMQLHSEHNKFNGFLIG